MDAFKYFLTGWIILIVAILINIAAGKAGIMTWYDFLLSIAGDGLRQVLSSLSAGNILFLFIIYPGIFGVVVYLSNLWTG